MKRTATAMRALALAASAALALAPVRAQTTLVSNAVEGFSVINVGNLETAMSRSNSRPGPMRRGTR